MVASLSGMVYQQGNEGDPDLAMIAPGAQALGDASDLYRFKWVGNLNSVDTEFTNGQFWDLEVYDPALDPDGDPSTGDEGWSVVPGYANLVPRNDMATELGAGDDYVVFEDSGNFVLFDLRGNLPTTPTTLEYRAEDENGNLATGDNDGELDFYDAYAAPVCFARGTLIETPEGPRRIEDLRTGMIVQTLDAGPQPVVLATVQFIGSKHLQENPRKLPIKIAAGALGAGVPVRDLIVSPQHRILLRGLDCHGLTQSSEVLIPANKLVGLPGIERLSVTEISYHHILLEEHELVIANGAAAETLLPSSAYLARNKGRTEGLGHGTCRPVVDRKEAKNLVSKILQMKLRDLQPALKELRRHESDLSRLYAELGLRKLATLPKIKSNRLPAR